MTMNQPREVVADAFRGDNAHLILCIEALLDLDERKALAPHGIGGHARTLLQSAAIRLAATQPGASAGGEEPWTSFAQNDGQGGRVINPSILDSPIYAEQMKAFKKLRLGQHKEITDVSVAIRAPAKTEGEAECSMCSRWKAVADAAQLAQSIADKHTPQQEARAVVTVLAKVPNDEGVVFSREDWIRLDHLPAGTVLYTAPQPAGQAAVTDEMVERACIEGAKQAGETWPLSPEAKVDKLRGHMRAILTASRAGNAQQAGEAGSA